MLRKTFKNVRLGLLLVILSALLAQATVTFAVNSPDLFVGNFGGHLASGTVYRLHAGEKVRFFVANHGGVGSTLSVTSVTASYILGSSGLSFPAHDADATPYTLDSPGGNKYFDVQCTSNPVTLTGVRVRILSDDPNEATYDLLIGCQP
ncbi:MAG: hypothetical protein ABI835_18200 [Chloroflexota bacterium]